MRADGVTLGMALCWVSRTTLGYRRVPVQMWQGRGRLSPCEDSEAASDLLQLLVADRVAVDRDERE